MTETADMLRSIPIFAELDDADLADLAGRCRQMTFKRNSVLMTEGEPGESLILIKSGSAKVFVSDEDGHELVLYVEGPGSYIGDIALLDDAPRSASVVTLEKTIVLSMAKQDFLQAMKGNPEIPLSIIRTLTRRLRRATDGIRSLALDNVYRRLADKLVELAEDTDEDQFSCLPRRYSHQELGNMIGASREMVGKIMAELIKGEYVEITEAKRIRILKTLPRDW